MNKNSIDGNRKWWEESIMWFLSCCTTAWRWHEAQIVVFTEIVHFNCLKSSSFNFLREKALDSSISNGWNDVLMGSFRTMTINVQSGSLRLSVYVFLNNRNKLPAYFILLCISSSLIIVDFKSRYSLISSSNKNGMVRRW